MLSGDTITHSSANDDGGAIYEDGTGALHDQRDHHLRKRR